MAEPAPSPTAPAPPPPWLLWLQRTWPWASVVATTVAATIPLWSWREHIYLMNVHTNHLRTPWFHEVIARKVGAGEWIQTLDDFDHNTPWSYLEYYPTTANCVMSAPLSWGFGWLAGWNLSIALAVLLNGLGVAVLARAVGCRGLGIAVAGALGILVQPVLKETVWGRPSAIYFGLAAASLAALIWTLPGEQPRSRARLTLAIVAGGALGALTTAIYPPHILLLIPIGLVLCLPRLRKVRLRQLVPPLAAMGLGVVLALPSMHAILASRVGNEFHAAKYHTCPAAAEVMSAANLVGVTPTPYPEGDVPVSVLALGAWLLGLTALLHRRKRWLGACLLGIAAAYGLFALGPCPTWRFEVAGGSGGAIPVLDVLLEPVQYLRPALTDLSRFGMAAAIMLALACGLGSEALVQRARALAPAGRRLPALLGAVLLALAGIGHVAWFWGSELTDPRLWHQVDVPATARFLATADGEPAAELPWSTKQWASVLASPGSPRVNPLDSARIRPTDDPLLDWLNQVGMGEMPDRMPTPAEISATDVRWVFHDGDGCFPYTLTPVVACDDDMRRYLYQALGSPSHLGDNVLFWDLTQPRVD